MYRPVTMCFLSLGSWNRTQHDFFSPAHGILFMDSSIGQIIRGRRTIGSYRPELPPADVVEAAIEVASWAPNHKKTEPWHAYELGPQSKSAVIELNSRLIEKKKGSAEADSKRKSWSAVPGWIAVTCIRSDDAFRHEEDYAACCCFVQNLMLALWSSGIGTKWSTGDVTREPDFFQILDIDPSKERVVGLIWYGYPAVVPEQNRKPLGSFLTRKP
jgi:nitroreductase